ncbi:MULTISPECIES: hypothetical protein [unclassified Enterococcus]|uniref:phage tail protein n=1 Tax=unclassified Enterococcus TaxID=2608891 RepID=UPI0013EBF968|nr:MULTISPECIES: hypothetical protein [unclassified Enterococcus]
MGDVFTLIGTINLDIKQVTSDLDATEKKGNTVADKLEGFFTKASEKISAVFTPEKMIDFGKMTVQAASSAQELSSQFGQVFGELEPIAQKTVEKMGSKMNILPERIKPTFSSMTSLFKGLGMDTETAMKKSEQASMLAADASAFYGTSLEDASGSMTSFLNGNYEAGESIGLLADDTQMAQFAIQEGIVGSTEEWGKLDEATKQATRLDYAKNLLEQSGVIGQASNEAGNYQNVTENLKQSWQDFLAKIGTPILEALTPIIENITKGLEDAGRAVQQLPGFFSSFINDLTQLQGAAPYITLVAGAIGVLALALNAGAIAQGIYAAATSIATAATTAFSAIMAVLTSPITLVIAAITALIAIGIYLYQNWSSIGPALANIWQGIKNTALAVWDAIKSTISTIVQAVVSAVVSFFTGLWNNITNIFNGVRNVASTVWNAIKSVVSSVVSGIVSTAVNLFNGLRNTVSNIWNGISSAISTVVNAVKNTISNVWSSLSNTVSGIFNGVKSAVEGPMNAVKDFIKGVIDTIKGLFNFNLKFPEIKLPQFRIKNGSINPLDWIKNGPPTLEFFAKGGILTQPTFFGMNGPNPMIGGEAGAEAVAPIDTLMGYVETAVRGVIGEQKEGDINVTNYITSPEPLTPREIAREMKWKLQDLAALK